MMPTEERGEIGSIRPTGWVQNKYEGVVNSNPPYLYNRCHLIAYSFTGENANEFNYWNKIYECIIYVAMGRKGYALFE